MSGVYARAGAMADVLVALIPTCAPRIVTCAGDKDVAVRPLTTNGRTGRVDVYGDGKSVVVAGEVIREYTDEAAPIVLAAYLRDGRPL